MGDTLTCGEALVGLLERYQVDTVFGIPGTHTIELYRGLVSSSIRHILARHEQGAAFMADGYSRASGKPGVCFLIAGPGLMNAATAIASAYNDSTPLLIITSVTHSAGRPRPVHLEIPTNVFPLPIQSEDFDRKWLPRPPSRRPAANPADLDAAVCKLRNARQPMIYVGGGAKHASFEVTALAERLVAPVANTVGGIGVVPGSHPLNLGSVSFEATRSALESADVLLALGTEMGSVDRWYNPIVPRGALIRVDIDPLKLNDHYGAAVALCADTALAAAAIVKELDTDISSSRTSDAHSLCEHIRAESIESLTALEMKHRRVWNTMQTAFPASTRFFGDMCQLAYTACRIVSSEEPVRQIHPIGFGCLGFGLPAAGCNL